MKKILLISSLIFLSFNNLSFSNEYKLTNIKPKDLVNDGYVLQDALDKICWRRNHKPEVSGSIPLPATKF